jgi:hypothetical protein
MGTPAKLVIVSTLYLVVVISAQWKTFSTSYSLSEYEHMYSESQYVKGDRNTKLMGDGDIYTYAGIRYVQGEDPTKINFEHSPLVKYAYGLSYIVTGKPNWILIPFFYIAVFSFWHLSSNVLQKSWSKWLSLLLFLGHSTIYTAIPQTMLDFPMTAMLLLTLAVFLATLKSKSTKSIFIFGITAGTLLLTKYPLPLLAILIGLLYLSLYFNKVLIKNLVTSFCLMCLTYLLGYLAYFIHGNSLMDFMRFEWWRWKWFSGKTDSPKGMIWQTIFTGRYPKWWENSGDYIQIPHWNIYWPINLLLFVLSWTIRNVIKNPLFPYQVWIIISLAAYSLGVAEDRFLVPLIPGFSLFGALWLEKLFASSKNGIIANK